MKMAKASEADLDMAMELCSAIDALTGSWPTLPTGLCKPADDEPDETFDCDDDRQCGTVLRHLLAIAERASLLRVVWGAAVMLDPRNQCVDPDADTIEHHPDTIRWRKLRDLPATTLPPGPMRDWLLARPGGAVSLDKMADALPTCTPQTEAA